MTTKEALVIVSEADYMRDDWQAALAVLSALAEENEQAKAERDLFSRYCAEFKARAEKAEVELELVNKAWDIKQKQLEKAEAELDAARPLLEAVEKWDGVLVMWDDIGKVALAYRSLKDAEVKK